MGIGSSGVVNCANTYLGTANYTVADGYVADRTVIVDGNGPAQLNLNFTRNEVLDPRITFSRTSNATRVNAQGLIETVAVNQPRFDYDPVTLAPKGLLIEEQRTNLLTYSEQFDNVVWSKVRANITTNATSSPSGVQDADALTEDSTANNTHLTFSSSISVATGTIYTYTVYAKAFGRNWLNLQIGTGTEAYGAIVPFCFFNISNGTLGTFGNATGSISAVGNGWYRCTLTAIATTAATTTNMRFKLADSGSTDAYTGNGTSGIYLWGAQLEAGAFPTSYIPTTTAQVTRTADNASMVGTNFSSWYNQSEGTLVCSSDSPQTTTIATMNWYLTNNAVDNTMFNRKNLANTISTGVVVNNVAQGDIVSGTTISANVTAQSAFSYKLNDLAISVNGAAVGTDSLANIPFVEKLYLGTNAGAGQVLNGHLKSFKFFSKRFINTYLQSLTQ